MNQEPTSRQHDIPSDPPFARITRRHLLGAGLGAGALAVSGLGTGTGRGWSTHALAQEPKTGGSAAIGAAPDVFPERFNPDEVYRGVNTWMQSHLYDSFLRLGADDATIEPGLAERWEISEDGLTYTLHLRDALFHDGSPVTAEDVVFSLERSLAWAGSSAKSAGTPEVVDERTVVARLAEPSAPFPIQLTGTPVLPAKLIEAQKLAFYDQPVGSGPFMLDSWDLGSEVVLKRNPTHWDTGRPYLDEIRFVILADPAERLARLQSGEIDILPYSYFELTTNQADTLRANPDVVVLAEPALEVFAFGVNTSRPPFDDKTLRQAIGYAIDRDEIVATVLHGFASPATALYPPQVPWHDPSFAAPTLDVEKAKALVAASAGKDGFAGEFLSVKGDPTSNALARAVANQLARIGGRIAVVEVELDEIGTRFGANRYDFFPNWVQWRGDPHFSARNYVHSNSDGGLTHYPTAELDALIAEGAATLDPARRLEIYRDIERKTNEGAFWIFYAQPRYVSALRKPIQGFHMSADQTLRLWEVWRDDV